MTTASGGKRDDPVNLTIGSRLALRSVASRDEVLETRGTFKGVVTVGTADALAIILDDSHGDLQGKTRLIPSHVILALDIVEQAASDDEPSDGADMHYT